VFDILYNHWWIFHKRGRTSWKKHLCKVYTNLVKWFRGRNCLKKCWRTHGRWTTDNGTSQKLILRTFSSGELITFNFLVDFVQLKYTVSFFGPLMTLIDILKVPRFCIFKDKIARSGMKLGPFNVWFVACLSYTSWESKCWNIRDDQLSLS
jgi:hypothetical protein